MKPEFDDRRPVVGEHPLEFGDVQVRLAPLLSRDEFLDAVVQDAAVPGMVENGHFAAVGNLEPEAPEPRVLLLVGAGRGDGVELEPAGVQPGGERGNGAALAGGFPAFEHDDRGLAVVPAGLFEVEEAALQGGQLVLPRLLSELAVQIHVFEHFILSSSSWALTGFSPSLRGTRS